MPAPNASSSWIILSKYHIRFLRGCRPQKHTWVVLCKRKRKRVGREGVGEKREGKE